MEAWALWAAPKASLTNMSARAGEGGGEFGVVGFLTGVETEVFEEEDVTGGKGLGLGSDSITDYGVCHLDRSADEVGEASGDGGEPELVVHLALGPTHV